MTTIKLLLYALCILLLSREPMLSLCMGLPPATALASCRLSPPRPARLFFFHWRIKILDTDFASVIRGVKLRFQLCNACGRGNVTILYRVAFSPPNRRTSKTSRELY